jgi:lipoprotein NlpD
MARAAIVAGLLVLASFAVLLAGCGTGGPAPVEGREGYPPAPSGFYRIRDGDSLHAIAFRKGLDYRRLAEWNSLSPPYRIYAGKLMRVEPPLTGTRKGRPREVGSESATGRQVAQRAQPRTVPAKASKPSKVGAKGLSWRWPLAGKVKQTFRKGDRTRQGIRIAGRLGQPVLAAEAGDVVYSGSGLKGYGNLIIVKHNDKYLSAYGFNRRLLVKEGERVNRGQRVAEVGQASSGAYLLHFEIRREGTAVDPLDYLPRSP